MEISFITTPKPGDDLPFRNALGNWHALDAEVLVLDGNERQAKELGYRHIVDCERGAFDLPYLNSMVNLARDQALGKFLVLTSDHLIFLSGLSSAIRLVSERFDEFFIVGRRYDLDLNEIDYRGDWKSTLWAVLQERGGIGSPAAKDYFIFPKSLEITIPPFLVGREWWDTWFVWYARQKHIPMIDATQLILGIHQNHKFLTVDGSKKPLTFDDAGVYNERLFWSLVKNPKKGFGSIDYVPHEVVKDGQGNWVLSDRT